MAVESDFKFMTEVSNNRSKKLIVFDLFSRFLLF
jgi:hypothetical protein